MKKQNLFLILALTLVILIVGASVLYNYLGDTVKHDSLITEDSDNEENEENKDTQKTPAPDFTVVDSDGNKHSLSDFKGKPAILNFWASWCGPCKSEMPDFEEIYKEYKEEIHFMFVNLTDGFQETQEKADSYIKEQGYTFPVYYDKMFEATRAYNTSSIPATYFIDEEGNIAAWAQGAIQKTVMQKGIDMIYNK